MKNNPTYSIIIPHYNSWTSLEKLVDSIPVDTEFEVIVVDDYSEKGYTEDKQLQKARIEQKIKERNGKFLSNSSKKGAGTCRNIGLQHAHGKWILFADADDYFLPSLKNVIEKYKDSDSDIIYFAPTSEYAGTNIKAHRHEEMVELINKFLEKKGKKREIILKYNWAAPWSKIYRKSLIEQNKIFFSETLVSNDIYFSMLTAYYAKKIDATKETIYCYVRRRGTLTTTNNEQLYDIRVDEFIKVYRFLRAHLSSQDFRLLNITGKVMIGTALVNGYSLQKIARTYAYMKSYDVRMWSVRAFYMDLKMFVNGVKRKFEERKVFSYIDEIKY